MKQLLQNMRSGETYVAEVPRPAVKPGMALIRTSASLVSAGTERMVVEFAEKSLLGKAQSRPDLVKQVLDKARREGLLTTVEAAFNRLDQPMVLGYASAGTIAGLGENMPGFQVGERVACAGGGYAVHAEYAVVPRNLLVPLPAGLDFEQAAFATLGAIALHGFRLAGVQIGERIAIIGLGLLGLLAAGICRAAGCQVLGIDIDPERVRLGEAMGVHQAVLRPAAEAAALVFSQGRGLDAVLICADTPSPDPIELAGQIARQRARVVAVGAVGLQVPRKVYYEKELTLINSRSYGPGRYDPDYEEAGQDYPIGYVRWTEGRNLAAVVDLMASGALDVRPLISHRFPLERAPEAYELITGKRSEPFVGILLTYPALTASPAAEEEEPAAAAQAAPETPPGLPAGARPDFVRLGVVGAGNFATAVMLPAVSRLPQIQLVRIASASGVSARHAADKFKFSGANQGTAENIDELLDDPAVNTIAVLTRHHLHAAQVGAALNAGKHVFCEKPLALDTQALADLHDSLEANSTRALLTVGYNRRFAPLAQKLASFLQDRQEPLMAHYRVNAGFLPLNHWLHDPDQGGGRILGEGCHFIDFLAFLTGAPPVEVQAVGLPDQGRYQEDNVLLTFRFPDGSIGTVSYLANGDKAFPKERVEVFCGGKVAVLDDYRRLETVYLGKRTVTQSRLRQDKGFLGIWEAFAQAILQGGPLPIPYDHLFGVNRAAFAAQSALRLGTPQQI